MLEKKVCLNSIEKVKEFVNLAVTIDCDMDLVSGRYVIDAKSIMGVFSLDLSKNIDFHVHTDSELTIKEVESKLGKFFV